MPAVWWCQLLIGSGVCRRWGGFSLRGSESTEIRIYRQRLCGHVRPQIPVTYKWDNCRINTTPLLALYCHLNDLIAGTVLLPTQTTIVPIYIRYIDQPIAPIRLLSRPDRTIVLMYLRSTDRPIDKLYVQPLSLPDARTVLLPESDNCHAYTPATHRPNNHACTPTISRPTGRPALYLTTITTAAGTVLPPRQTAAMLTANSDLTVTALPAAYQYFAAPACS